MVYQISSQYLKSNIISKHLATNTHAGPCPDLFLVVFEWPLGNRSPKCDQRFLPPPRARARGKVLVDSFASNYNSN